MLAYNHMYLHISENCWLDVVSFRTKRFTSCQKSGPFPLAMLDVGKNSLILLLINLEKLPLNLHHTLELKVLTLSSLGQFLF